MSAEKLKKIFREGTWVKVSFSDGGFLESQSVEAHLLYEILQAVK